MGMLQRLRGGQMGDMFDGMDEQGMGELMGMAGGGGAKRAAPALSRAEMQARVDDKKKRRARAKQAAKSRKKNKKR